MFTPISKTGKVGAALALGLFLSACDVSPGDVPAPQATRVSGDRLVIAGPSGYCVDKASSQQSASGGFVVMARCDALGGGGGRPDVPALLTVAVEESAGSLPAAPLLAAQAQTPTGRATIAGAGELLETRVSDGVFFARLKDPEASNAALVDTHWRAIFELDGHLVTARVTGFAERPISAEAGFSTLNALAKRIKADNAVSQLETIQTDTRENANSRARQTGILRRIFG